MAFTWSVRNLVLSRRHVLAKLRDTTNSKRKRWVQHHALRRNPNDDFQLKRTLQPDFSFLVLGDTGEGDASQWVLVKKVVHEGKSTAFMIIASDVIYPAGRSKAYREKFYLPYQDYDHDIYAIPGNHDWYDELTGFMLHFCDARSHFRNFPRLKWHMEPNDLRKIRQNEIFQPNMYFYIDHPKIRIVCLDTGINHRIDGDQLDWLRTVSTGTQSKLLITGSPFYVDGERSKRHMDPVLKIVNDPSNGYIMVIAGNRHNFQACRITPSTEAESKPVWHIVNGGGGASRRSTHKIPKADDMKLGNASKAQLREDTDFYCYPSSADSKAAKRQERLWRRVLPDALGRSDRPPYYKSFMKLEVDGNQLRAYAYGVKDFTRQEDLRSEPIWRLEGAEAISLSGPT